jgi:hypothetical protein
MTSPLTKLGLVTMAFLSVLVAVMSMRFIAVPYGLWLQVGPEIHEVILHVPLQALTHMIVAPFALLLGPFQFFPGLRAKHPRFHRWCGRIYVAACLISGVAALATAPFASGGPIAGIGFAMLAISWIGATGWAWRAAVGRNFDLHRKLMRYSYAMTFGAVTLRLQIPLGVMFLHLESYRELSVWLAYTSWIPNVIVVAIYNWWKTPRRSMSALEAAE